jgi:3-hydroxybutyryl-CoA dehydratase
VNELGGYDIDDLDIGMSATFAKTITEADIVLFAAASGDNNALHINEEFARTTQFKGRIAHGMLSASVISAAIAGRLPGPGTIYMSQNLRFMAPVRPGDTVHATVTVKELIPEKCRAWLSTVCTVKSKIVIDGVALVMITSREGRKIPRAFGSLAET